jgi:hypothetical protein
MKSKIESLQYAIQILVILTMLGYFESHPIAANGGGGGSSRHHFNP